jgi:hypothetical protein
MLDRALAVTNHRRLREAFDTYSRTVDELAAEVAEAG